MPRRPTVLPIVLLLSAAGVASSASAVSEPDRVAWVKAHAIPLRTAEAGQGFDDLRALDPVIGDARIVALGEPTHGSREVFQMKHRLLEYLASEKGFTVFAIEANMPEAERMSEYVLEGRGSPEAYLAGMYFPVWRTEEVAEMTRWMRRFNESGKGPLRFEGFDMQTADIAIAEVSTFVGRVDTAWRNVVSAQYGRAASDLRRCGTSRGARTVQGRKFELRRGMSAADIHGMEPAPGWSRIQRTLLAKAQASCDSVLEDLITSRERCVARTSIVETEHAIQNARIVLQHARLAKDRRLRDEFMAENVRWILKQAGPNSRIVLWAHNWHVSRWKDWMGSYLDPALGDSMLVIGFSTHEGEYRAAPPEGGRLRAFPLESSIEGSFESMAHATGIPIFAVDLRSASKRDAASSWLRSPVSFGGVIGAGQVDHRFLRANLYEGFDVMIHIDRTSAARPLP